MIKKLVKILQLLIVLATIVFGILYFFSTKYRSLFMLFLALSFFVLFINTYKKNKIVLSIFYLLLGVLFLLIFVFV